MIKFLCDNCGESISVSGEHAGKRGKCKQCNAVVLVPSSKVGSTVLAKCITCSEMHEIDVDKVGTTVECGACDHGLVYVQDLKHQAIPRLHRSCESCKWASWRETAMWRKEADLVGESIREMTGSTLTKSEELPHRAEAECRRYPPTVVVDISSSSDGTLEINSSTSTEFPRVFARHWCGEWASVSDDKCGE